MPRADLTALGLKALRFESYKTYASFDAAVTQRRATPDERRENAALVARVLDYEFSSNRSSADQRLLTEDAYLSFADTPDQRGPGGLTVRRVNFASAFTTAGITVKKLAVESGRTIVRREMRLRNDDSYLGLAATGRELATTGSAYARIEDGRVTQWIEVLDILRVIRQLGGLAAVMPGSYPDQ